MHLENLNDTQIEACQQHQGKSFYKVTCAKQFLDCVLCLKEMCFCQQNNTARRVELCVESVEEGCSVKQKVSWRL